MANMVARPQSLQDYLHDQLGWFDLDAPLRQMCDRIIYNLDANGYLQGRLEDLIEPDAPPGAIGPGPARPWPLVQRLDPPGVAARDLRECLLLQLKPGMPYYEQLKTLITGHLEDIEHNRLPVIERRTGYSIDADPTGAGRAAEAESQAGGRISARPSCRTSRPTCSSSWTTTASTSIRLEDGRTPNLYISPYYRKLLTGGARRRQDPRIHQAQDQLGPVADRVDRAAPQHAHPRGPGDRRSSDRVS